jgi:hypothetical protein
VSAATVASSMVTARSEGDKKVRGLGFKSGMRIKKTTWDISRVYLRFDYIFNVYKMNIWSYC